jgi:Protein of unknown function (DUF1643)
MADLSACGPYQCLLTRQLAAAAKLATFIMLNPSTADADRDDATIRKCVRSPEGGAAPGSRSSTCSLSAPPTPGHCGVLTILLGRR